MGCVGAKHNGFGTRSNQLLACGGEHLSNFVPAVFFLKLMNRGLVDVYEK